MAINIMIVENNIAVAKILSEFLNSKKYTCIEYLSSEEAIKEIEKNKDKYHMAIVNYDMPKINGAMLVKKMKGLNKRIFVIIMSDNIIPKRYLNIIKKEADYFLTKPVDLTELDEKLNNFQR